MRRELSPMRPLVTLAAVALLLTSLAGCSRSAPAGAPGGQGSVATRAPATQVEGVTPTSIKIGMEFTTSGAAAIYGLAYQRTAELVFGQVNSAGGVGGRKLEWVAEDDGGEPQRAVAAIEKLLQRDKVFAIYGGVYTPPTVASYTKAVDAGVPYYSPGNSAPNLTVPLKPLVFQANTTLDQQATPIAKLVASMKPKKIAFVKQNDSYGSTTLDATTAELKQHNLSVASTISIEASAVDATGQVAQLQRDGADVVIFGGTEKPLSALIRQMYRSGVKAPVVSYGGGATAAIDNLVSTEAPIDFYAWTPLADYFPNGGKLAPLLAEFKQKFPDVQPNVWWVQGYAAAQVFVEALKAAGPDLTRESLVKALENLPQFKSEYLPYPVKFTPQDHRGTHGSFLYGYRGGKLAFIGDELK